MPINLDRLRTGGAFGGPLAQNALPVAPALRELTPGDRIGAFRIERELSRGGMGIVYLAERADGEFAQRVALKWLAGVRDRETAEALFRRERDIVAGLEHPGIARLIDGGRSSDEMLWFAMELVDGEPIDRWCEQRVLSHARRVALVVELTEALGFAHQRLLIHRDIKPSNVLVGTDGRVKLLDFGIARLLDQTDVLGQAALTPGYASPEQWAGGEITVASDVYQVGLLLAVLLDVLDPVSPASHATRTAQEGSLLAEPVVIDTAHLSHLPRDLAAIVQRATALEPAQRYASVLALGDDLQRWLQRRPVAARDGGAIYRIGCLLRRHPVVAAAAAAAIAALMVLGWQLAIERNVARAEAARATQEAARATAEAERATSQAQRAQATLGFVTELLKWADPRNHGGEQVTVSAALERGAGQLSTTLDDQPSLRAELLQLVGSLYLMREDVDRSVPLLREARALLLADPQARRELLADNAINLAVSLGADDDTEALALLHEAAAVRGSSNELIALRVQARRHIASLTYRRGDIVAARAAMRAALDEALSIASVIPIETISIRTNLAGYVGDLGDHEAALALKLTNRDAALHTLGPTHPATSLASTTLARTLIVLGRLDEAAAVISADGEVRHKLWGPQHPQYGVHLQNVARLELSRGQRDQALRSIQAAIAISRSAGDVGQLQLSSQYGDLADIQIERGAAADAERAARAALDPALRRTAVVKDLGARRLSLVKALRLQSRFGAMRNELASIDSEIAPLPNEHPRRAAVLLERAGLAEHDGDPDAARGFLRAAGDVLQSGHASVGRDRLREQVAARIAAISGRAAPEPAGVGIRVAQPRD